MDFSLLRVSSVSLGMRSYLPWYCEEHLRRSNPVCACGSGLLRRFAPRNNQSINCRLLHRRAKTGFEEVEVAAFICLADVPREHPAIAALEAGFGLLPFGASPHQFGF